VTTFSKSIGGQIIGARRQFTIWEKGRVCLQAGRSSAFENAMTSIVKNEMGGVRSIRLP
jgi:hypothetical protein